MDKKVLTFQRLKVSSASERTGVCNFGAYFAGLFWPYKVHAKIRGWWIFQAFSRYIKIGKIRLMVRIQGCIGLRTQGSTSGGSHFLAKVQLEYQYG